MHLHHRFVLLCVVFCLTTAAFADTNTVVVRVLDDSTYEPAMGAGVRLLHSGHGGVIMESGQTVFSGVSTGFDTLRIAAVGYYPLVLPISIRSGRITFVNVALKVITMHPGTSIPGCVPEDDPPPKDLVATHSHVTYFARFAEVQGTVIDVANKPVSKAIVALLDSALASRPDSIVGNNAIAHALTDASGKFHFTSVIPGSYVLRAISRGRKSNQIEIELRDGQTENVTLHLKEDHSKSGH